MKIRCRTGSIQSPCSAVSVACILSSILTLAAQTEPAKPTSGLINPRAIAFSPATMKVYAVDTSHGTVQIYNDANQQMRSVKVGSEPISIAVNKASGAVYVANAAMEQ